MVSGLFTVISHVANTGVHGRFMDALGNPIRKVGLVPDALRLLRMKFKHVLVSLPRRDGEVYLSVISGVQWLRSRGALATEKEPRGQQVTATTRWTATRATTSATTASARTPTSPAPERRAFEITRGIGRKAPFTV